MLHSSLQYPNPVQCTSETRVSALSKLVNVLQIASSVVRGVMVAHTEEHGIALVDFILSPLAAQTHSGLACRYPGYTRASRWAKGVSSQMKDQKDIALVGFIL